MLALEHSILATAEPLLKDLSIGETARHGWACLMAPLGAATGWRRGQIVALDGGSGVRVG
jgi:hypothetical protein